ncbi:MAG: 4-hydroxy-3-methylbut-2-enyl diphosphate reductase [Gaiellaceae bacterium]
MSRRVLVASPRSFCAGVVRAIDIVERLLERHGPPVYVRHEIVHNVHVVRDLEARGAVFVESEEDVPEGALVVLSAHGVAPAVYEKCAERGLEIVDAVCPLVSKVHAEARRYAARGHKIALVGHAGHVEVEGTMGEAPDSIVLVETPEDAHRLELEEGQRLAYLTQTTLSLDDTADVVEALRERVPDLVGPPSADICYATQNRQDAVKRLCEEATLVLVVGSRTSSNANRLVEVARSVGADAHLIDDERDLDPAWLESHDTVGLTAGASSPEILVERVVARLDELGISEREDVEIAREDVFFRLPPDLRDEAESSAAPRTAT